MKARTIALAIALLCANPIAHAQTDSRVYPPNAIILGMTYGDWSAAWWQFFLQIPNVNNNHPFVDPTPGVCNNGNQPAGPMYFLAGVFSNGQQVVRTCTVPAETPILFAVANDEYSNLEVANAGVADLRKVAFSALGSALKSGTSTLSVSLDGVSVNSLDQFHFESPAFSFTVPTPVSDFIFYTRMVSPSHSSSPIAVSDGFWIAIKPLSVGQHTLSFSAPDLGINMRYQLNVQ